MGEAIMLAVGIAIGIASTAGGVFLGAWLAERSRQREHNLVKFDQPERPTHRSYIPETAESRIDKAAEKVEQSYRQDTIANGVNELRQLYKDEGQQVPSDSKLKTEVELMLNASTQGESQIE